MCPFRRDRRTISTDRPRRIPAAIDSNGNPGTAGTTRGVVMLVAEVAVIVMRLRATDVLVESWVVVDVDVCDTVVETWAVLVVDDAVVLLVDVIVVVIGIVVVAICFGLGGSR